MTSTAHDLFDSIIPCFGSRFSVILLPEARRYRVLPLGSFHHFDWQKPDGVGISISTCPQIVASETARIGVTVNAATRCLPFADGNTFAAITQAITPLTTTFICRDSALPIEATFTFRSAFYPQNFEYSTTPGYAVECTLTNPGATSVTGEAFFGLPLADAEELDNGFRTMQPIVFPEGIDHTGIDGLTFEQIILTDAATCVKDRDKTALVVPFILQAGKSQTVTFFHSGYIPQPTLNVRGDGHKFGYTTLWENAEAVAHWWIANKAEIIRKGKLFESTITEAQIAPELKAILAAAFKGVASNAWWGEQDWFSVMEIGAYHSTLDVDYQMALFFFQYWPELIGRMVNQWALYYTPGSGYLAHDVGQHLEALGNRYGGPDSAMKVEENCNYILLLHHFWCATADSSILADKHTLLTELIDFLIASDTTGSGLPNRYADNTNDWGTTLITASEEQSYHGVRLVAAFSAAAQIAQKLGDDELAQKCRERIPLINATLEKGWLGDHYPISLADSSTAHHYSMWTPHGLLYPLRSGMQLDIDLDKLRIDLISSTARTFREHGCIHSTADVRGWLAQNLWRDCIAAYLGIDMTGNVSRYLGHGEYVSYEDTTILEVANELMVVPGATAEHTYAGEHHTHPMVDGHPRPACGFGLLYALAGVQFDAIDKRLRFQPVAFPLKIALTHLADWENEHIPWLTFSRSIPNQDAGQQDTIITYSIVSGGDLLNGLDVNLMTDA